MKHRFKSKRVKKGIENISANAPDYSGIIYFNKRPFTLDGWLDTNSDISYVLEEITQDRLKRDKYLAKKYYK